MIHLILHFLATDFFLNSKRLITFTYPRSKCITVVFRDRQGRKEEVGRSSIANEQNPFNAGMEKLT